MIARKNYTVAVLSSLLFGPLGVCYTNTTIACVLIVVGTLMVTISGWAGVPAIWIISVVYNIEMVNKHNKLIDYPRL